MNRLTQVVIPRICFGRIARTDFGVSLRKRAVYSSMTTQDTLLLASKVVPLVCLQFNHRDVRAMIVPLAKLIDWLALQVAYAIALRSAKVLRTDSPFDRHFARAGRRPSQNGNWRKRSNF